MKARSIRLAGIAAMSGAAIIAGAGAASASTLTPVAGAHSTATTRIANRPDGGNGGTWAYDTFTRTLTVSQAVSQASAPEGDTLYTATITDKGSFSTVGGALAPNQSTAGVKVTRNGVKGSINGTYSLTVTAPTSDTPTGKVPATENDDFGSPTVTTTNWPKQAFATQTGVTVAGGTYSWTYKTGCETWVDSSTNGDGNLAADGNITGKKCTTTTAPSPSSSPTSTRHPAPVHSRGAGYVHSLYATGLCLDNKDAHWVNNNPVQLWACGASALGVAGGDQQLRLHDGHLQFMHDGTAWDVTSLGAGTQAVIETPGNGVGVQGITREGDYYVAANHSVLDDRAFGDVSGTEALFYAQNGGKNQLWSAPK